MTMVKQVGIMAMMAVTFLVTGCSSTSDNSVNSNLSMATAIAVATTVKKYPNTKEYFQIAADIIDAAVAEENGDTDAISEQITTAFGGNNDAVTKAGIAIVLNKLKEIDKSESNEATLQRLSAISDGIKLAIN